MRPEARRRVLVIEDDEDLVFLVSMLLRAEGYEVATAPHGKAALDHLHLGAFEPDVILLDMKMPVMGGAEFARAYEAHFGRRTPIVVITASEDAERRAAEIGADGWIGKPFEAEALLETVRRHAPGVPRGR